MNPKSGKGFVNNILNFATHIKRMHIHYFQHDHFEDLGYIGEWAASHHITTSCTRLDLDPLFPLHETYDWLVVLGGKMGVNDAAAFPWIREELDFIRHSIQMGKVVLGICLGSQMIAAALGARVYKNTEPEMGFYPVLFNANAKADSVFRHFPEALTVMHMHFDTFELPAGAVAMAKSEITGCQAFRFAKNVFALQFHFEVSVANAPVFIQEITPELVPGRLVQQPEEMLSCLGCCELNNRVFAEVLDTILQENS